MSDKIVNVRMKALELIKNNIKVVNAGIEKQVEKMKDDSDQDVKSLAKKLKL